MKHRVDISEAARIKLSDISKQLGDDRNASQIAELCIDTIHKNLHDGRFEISHLDQTQKKLDLIIDLLQDLES